MRRKSFDTLLTGAGVLVAVVMLLAGGLLSWGSSFVSGQVHDQLAAQKIFFPPKGDATKDPRIGPFVDKYAGKQLVTGAQAHAYADHFIAVHLADISGGKTYAELSTASRAAPTDLKLAGQVQTVFRGETLRGLLLNAYAFGTMGTIAFYASMVAYVGAALLLLLSLLGLMHLRRVDPQEEVLAGSALRRQAPVTA